MGSEERPSGTMPIARGSRILLLDHDVAARIACERVLVSSGYEVVSVDTAQGALQALGARDYDLVLSDLQVPDLSGLELLRTIRQIDLDLPVVLMSGSASLHGALAAV